MFGRCILYEYWGIRGGGERGGVMFSRAGMHGFYSLPRHKHRRKHCDEEWRKMGRLKSIDKPR